MSGVEDQKWIDGMMAKIIEDLGLDVGEAQYELSKSVGFVMTVMYHVHLRFKNKTSNRNEKLSMVLKRSMRNFNEIANIDLQFRNEILFYQTYVQPNERHLYARCYYVDTRTSGDLTIALENVNERGYYPYPYAYDAPLAYTLTAMQELGRFHGKGYVMKEQQREKFFDIVAQLQEVRYIKTGNMYEIIANVKAPRAVEYLRQQGHDPVFCDKVETVLSNSFEEVLMKMVQPLEPLSTLCHGDFTLNNILFKTDGESVCRAMLIDFALMTYSTPVVDLSTYLCISCLDGGRREIFSDIMRAYHDALTQYLLDAGIQDIEKYSYNALMDDFKRGALFGFVLLSTFIPILTGDLKPEVFVQEVISLGTLESAKKQKYLGGDEVSKILADMLLHLRDLGCLEYILQ